MFASMAAFKIKFWGVQEPNKEKRFGFYPGQYGGKSQIWTFYPIIGFQYTTFHKGTDPKVRVVQCNMVN